MPFPQPITHVRVAGHFGPTATSAVEEWVFGFYLGGGMLPAGYDAALVDFWISAGDYIAATGVAGMSNEVWLTEVQAAAVGADGKLQEGYYSRYGAAPVSGGVQASAGEFQTSYAVTIDAGPPKPGRFNRFYPPPQRPTLTMGKISEADAIALATSAQTLLGQAQAVFGMPLRVVSERWGTGRVPVAIGVGRVPDTQRRRRRSLDEGRQEVAPPV